ncbi:ATP-dependent RecD-like DNA helicase [Candidatus Marinamargulisbacteria bacterium SCGC AG-439-L15]|nr:ATP-dependent RecD-like DNA helicase [Candidatus Marinamargulisbacteria bacterium SCGC AG-439-L15]RAP34161.1 ATP-dependent RecD-like DNA helicase [Candidatus Marinamargulisbacteria bacterium SCGC AG-439-L15]
METIRGYVERITFQSNETGFTVAKLKEPKKSDLTLIVGSIPSLRVGETVSCEGSWKLHPVHGMQFQVEKCEMEAPKDIQGLQAYLASGMVKGIGPVYAKRIVEVFGLETLDVIDNYPDRLLEVPGIGQRRVEEMKACWSEQRAIRDLMVWMQSMEVSPSFAQKIYQAYGDESISIIKDNPYRLAEDIWGVGFKTADTIAMKIGIEKNSPERLTAGIEYVLSHLSQEGHVCYPIDTFLQRASDLLESSEVMIKEQLEDLCYRGRIVISEMGSEGSFIWLKALKVCEEGIVGEFSRIQEAVIAVPKSEAKHDEIQEKMGIELAPNQLKAVQMAISEKVSIITGGPGTGKSTITKVVITILAEVSKKIVLAAPTGRAAKRLSELTGCSAKTIHSLLEMNFQEGGFKHNHQNPLSCDVVIIDESSMIDTSLMYSLLKAIPSYAKLILVGDVHQLPSVGPGNVLRDIIDSKEVPVTRLTDIYRQAANSKIVTNAHMILSGKTPDIRNVADLDFFFLEEEAPERILETIVGLNKTRLPDKYALDSHKDIQVLTPLNKGIIGTQTLNQALQDALNPGDNQVSLRGNSFRVGDKVMQLRNNYVKEVFNGDIAWVTEIDENEQILRVSLDDKVVEYDFSELDELSLAYAVSVHKFQGSECPCIIMPIHTAHYVLLNRQLLYTGVTRGKQLVVLVGSKRALSIAVKRDEVFKRYTGLLNAFE